MRVPVTIMPGLFMAVTAAWWNQLVKNLRQVLLQSWLNSIVPMAAVLPTLKMCAVPVRIPELAITAATLAVMSCMSAWPFVCNEICS